MKVDLAKLQKGWMTAAELRLWTQMQMGNRTKNILLASNTLRGLTAASEEAFLALGLQRQASAYMCVHWITHIYCMKSTIRCE